MDAVAARWPHTLKTFIFSSTVGIALLAFFGATLASSLLYERLIDGRTLETSREISRQNFNAVYAALSAGASRRQIDDGVAAAARSAFPTTVDDIALYAAGARSAAMPAAVADAMNAGAETAAPSGDGIVYAFPLRAAPECLFCHAEARAGELLGVVAVKHSLQSVTPRARIYYLALFLGLGLLVLLAAAGVTGYAARRVSRAVALFRGEVEAVNAVKDFDRFDVTRMDFGFEEFNRSFDDVALLVEKIRGVAVDKEVLEFEIRLLEKFIITSDVVRDWREFIKRLVLDIDPIIEANVLITIFRVDDKAYECEVFWRHRPSAGTAALFDEVMRRRLEGHALFQGVSLLPIVHNVADEKHALRELAADEIELQTRTLLLDAPKIGGIVGIGVQSPIAQDSARHMVIGSILTTLVNLVGSIRAIHKYTKDLEQYATRDPLTDLYNQRMFWELLGYEIGRARRHEQQFAVIMLDMDNFKLINDRYGHHFGDAFLQAFARLLHSAVRDGDLLARYGGDEFCVILPGAADTQAHMVAQRIAELLANFSIETPDGSRIRPTTSMGIAVFPKHGDSPKDLFLVADNMMYKAKKSGKNAIAIPSEDEMAEVFRKAGEKSILIQDALDRQRIVPFFQPISDTVTGAVAIHEVLMRIQLDDRVVTAGEFIEEAESMGVAHKMDYQLIEKAFAQVAAQGYTGRLFVNLSPKALIAGEFAARVSQLAEQVGIAPERIVFEITERETVSNLSLLETFVRDVKRQGFSFAIDDFGSGFSSFQYIKCFPVDYIKIEGEFIRNMLRDEVYLAFVKSIVTLAKELGIKTIAEHVEDAETLAGVARLGIDYAQGYHIARPSAALDLSAQHAGRPALPGGPAGLFPDPVGEAGACPA